MAGSTRKPITKYPNFGEKKHVRVSATTVLRKREPTNEFTMEKLPAMVWDYSNQRDVWPNGRQTALMEASQTTGHKHDTINKSGHPFALGNIDMGGAPDTRGGRFWKPPPSKKMLK